MRTYFHTHTHTHAYKGALESTTSSSEDSRRGAHFIFHQSIGLQLVKLILYGKRKKREMGKKSEKRCWKMLCLIDLRAKSVKRKRMSAFTPFPISLSINIHIHSQISSSLLLLISIDFVFFFWFPFPVKSMRRRMQINPNPTKPRKLKRSHSHYNFCLHKLLYFLIFSVAAQR